MDLGITSGLAALLEEQRRKRELEALKQQEAAAAQQEPATSPVLTPEVSTNSAPTPAPAGDGPVAGFSGSSSPGNREPRNTTGGIVLTRQGVGYGMSQAAVDANQLGADVQAAGQAAQPDLSGLSPIQGQGNVRPLQLSDQTPDPNANISAAIADQRGIGGQLRSLNQLERGGPITAQPNEQVQFDTQRDAENKIMGNIGNIGAALSKAGVAPPDVAAPPAPADPLAPKPKLTARQRAEAEVPPVDDMKGWQRVLLVMGAGLAGGLSKDASLGAKLAAMTPQNRRERLVKERTAEIMQEDKLALDTRQAEAQIAATERSTERADRQLAMSESEQKFSQGLQLARLELDVKRFQLDKDIRTMQVETAKQVAADRAEYNRRIAAIREEALKAGKVIPRGAMFIHPETGQLLTENPDQQMVTTTKSSEVTTGPDGKQSRTDKTDTVTKGPAGGGNGTRDVSSEEAGARGASIRERHAKRRAIWEEGVKSGAVKQRDYNKWLNDPEVQNWLRAQGLL